MDPTNANTALASAFVEELARCGLRHAVLSPGSRSTPLAVALWRQPAIDQVIVDERSAAFFALGAAQASGGRWRSSAPPGPRPPTTTRPSARPTSRRCPCSCSPPTGRRSCAGSAPARRSTSSSSTATSVRWFCEVGTHDADDAGLLHYRSVACRAFAAARGEPRPGPVHLNFPWRDPLGPEPGEAP